MRKLLVSLSAALLCALSFGPAAFASAPVAYTFTATDLGQGCWGGGTLYVGGSASGGADCSFLNGQVVFDLVPTGWSTAGPGLVTICTAIVPIKNAGPGTDCLTVPVTGGPVKVNIPGGDGTTLIRVTPVSG